MKKALKDFTLCAWGMQTLQENLVEKWEKQIFKHFFWAGYTRRKKIMTTWADPQGKVLHDGVSLSPTVCYLQQNHQHILWEKKAFTKAKKKCNKRTYFNSLGTQNEHKQLIWLNQALKTALRWLMMYWLYGSIFFYRAWKTP